MPPEMIRGQFLPARRGNRRAKLRQGVSIIVERSRRSISLELQIVEKSVSQRIARRAFQSGGILGRRRLDDNRDRAQNRPSASAYFRPINGSR
jgi:hypothetical protein